MARWVQAKKKAVVIYNHTTVVVSLKVSQNAQNIKPWCGWAITAEDHAWLHRNHEHRFTQTGWIELKVKKNRLVIFNIVHWSSLGDPVPTVTLSRTMVAVHWKCIIDSVDSVPLWPWWQKCLIIFTATCYTRLSLCHILWFLWHRSTQWLLGDGHCFINRFKKSQSSYLWAVSSVSAL